MSRAADEPALSGQHRPPADTRFSRRRFLGGATLAGVAAFLAACGNASTPTPSGRGSGAPAPSAASPGSSGGPVPASGGAGSPRGAIGELNFANRFGYIDLSDDGSTYPSLEEFRARTGVVVHYDESIDDDEQFVSNDLEGPLRAGTIAPWDLVVLSDWMAARLIRQGWLEAIDVAATPNFVANLDKHYRGRSFDPETKYAAPWQSGMTGIGFDRRKTGAVTSLGALWDPKYKGRIAYLIDSMRDTVGLAALKLGIDPSSISHPQFQAALAEVGRGVGDKLTHSLADESYVDAMAAGDVVVAMAYAADIATLLVPGQTADQDFQFAVPREGGMLWTDNLCIPKGARNKQQADAFINFYYDPQIAAQVEDYVNYVCPVSGVAAILKAKNSDVANSPLVFPPADVFARLRRFRDIDQNEENDWNAEFARAIGAG